jgi:hypothetical protein
MADPKRVVLDENENQIPEEMSGFLGYGTSDPAPPEYEMDRNELNWLQQSVMDFYQNESIDPGIRSALAALDDWMPGIPFHDIVPDPPTSLPGSTIMPGTRKHIEGQDYDPRNPESWHFTEDEIISADAARASFGKVGFVGDVLTGAAGAYKAGKYIKGAYTEAGSVNAALNNALQQVKNWRNPKGIIDSPEPGYGGSFPEPRASAGSRYDASDPNVNWSSLDNSRTGFLPPHAGQGFSQAPIYGREYAGGAFKRINNSGDLHMPNIDDGTITIGGNVQSNLDLNNLRPAYETNNGYVIYQDITDNRRFYSLDLGSNGSYTLVDDTNELESLLDGFDGTLDWNEISTFNKMLGNSPAVPSNIKGIQDSFANSMNPNTLSELNLSDLDNLPMGQELAGTLENGTKVILKNGDEVAGQKMFEDANNITIQTKNGDTVNIAADNIKNITRNTKGNPLTVRIQGDRPGVFNVAFDDKNKDVVHVGQLIKEKDLIGPVQPLTSGTQGSRLRFQATRLPDGQLEISHISLFADNIHQAGGDIAKGIYKMPDGTDFDVIADSKLHTRFTTETGELRQITKIVDNDTGDVLKEIITPGGRAAEKLIARTSLSGGKSLIKMMDMMPDDAIIRESDMTLDSLYVLIHQTVKKSQARVRAGKSPLKVDISDWQLGGSGKQSSQSASFMFGNERVARSNWSKQFDKLMQMPSGADQKQATLELVVEIQQKMNRAIDRGDLTSVHGNLFEVVAGTSGRVGYDGKAIGYSQFSVSGFKSIVAGLFGYSTWNEYSSMLKDENTNNVENQVFDQIQF